MFPTLAGFYINKWRENRNILMQPNLADKEEQVHMEAGYLDTS